MKNKVVQVFSKKDEEFVNILIDLGTKKSVARVLVFLLNRMEGTMREIERAADMSQPEVSQAVRYMVEQGWVKTGETRPGKNDQQKKLGRPIKMVSLAIPLEEIVRMIGEEKKTHANHQLSLLKKVRAFVV